MNGYLLSTCTKFSDALIYIIVSKYDFATPTLHKKWSLPLKVSSVNVTKSAENWGCGHIYWGNI